jgi:predicted transcriptional regulator
VERLEVTMRRRSRGALEHEVLTFVAEASAPVTVAETVTGLGDPDVAYTTVMTILTRLVDKGALVRERRGRAYVYAVAVAPSSMSVARAARGMRRLLRDEGHRADVLARFVAELDPDDERTLRRLLGGHREVDPSGPEPDR